MARVSFVVRNNSSASGSFIRYPDGSASPSIFPARTDYDSALRADGLQLAAAAATGSISTFSATAITYGSIQLDWSVALSTVSSVTSATSIVIVYSDLGIPQTVASGTSIVNTLVGVNTQIHTDLPTGGWAYYALFIHYTSTSGDDFYTKTAELQVLVPTDYGSTLTLWNQLPHAVKTADIAQGNFNFNTDIGQTHGDKVGPLFKYLSIIGYDMDYMRTLVDYIMISNDPVSANNETLDALANMMNLPFTASQLGGRRLRNMLDNIGVYKRSKGTPSSINLMLGAVSGSNSSYNAATHKYSIQSQRANYITVPKTGAGITTWREAYSNENIGTTALTLLQGAEFFVDADRSIKSEQSAVNQGTGASALNARYGSSASVDAVDPLLLTKSGENYLYLPGVSGNYVSIPDGIELAISGDLEIVVRVALDDWTPAANSRLVSKRTSGRGAFELFIATTGKICWDTIGLTASVESLTAPPFVDGTTYWVRVQRVASTGVVTFAWAADQMSEPTAWTTIAGSGTQPTGALSITTDNLYIGTYGGTQDMATGKFYRAIVRNGIGGTTVVDVNFTTGITSGNQLSLPFSGSASASSSPQYIGNLGTGGRLLAARSGSTTLVDTNDPLLLTWTGENYLWTPTLVGSGGVAQAPSLAAYDPTDLDVRVRLDPTNWAAPTINSSGFLVSHNAGADPNRGWVFRLNTGNVTFTMYDAGLVTGVRSYTTAASIPLSNGQPGWLRATYQANNGSSQSACTFYTSPDGIIWTQLGTTQVGVTGSLPLVNYPLIINGSGGGAQSIQAKFYQVQLRNGINGPIVFDANFTTGITSGGQTSFTESSSNAATVSITRYTSGRKATAVTRPVYLFGTNSYMEVVDNPLLNFSATDSFSVFTVTRQWTTISPGKPFLTKLSGTTGWAQTNNRQMSVGDGASFPVTPATLATAGTMTTSVGVRDASAKKLRAYNNGVATAEQTDTTTGSLSNAINLFIGVSSGSYTDFELFAAAVFRRVLTATEATLINTHYQGTETAESIALLSTAVFWIDATRSPQELAINRGTSGKKSVAVTRSMWLFGTNSYMEIADTTKLNFGATDSFTIVAIARMWGAFTLQVLVSKKDDNLTTAGYALRQSSLSRVESMISDGTTSISNAMSSATPSGGIFTVAAIRDVTADNQTTYVNSSVSTSTTDTTTGNLTTTTPFRIGRYGVSTLYADMELFAVAVFRRALTPSEITTINTYYGTV